MKEEWDPRGDPKVPRRRAEDLRRRRGPVSPARPTVLGSTFPRALAWPPRARASFPRRVSRRRDRGARFPRARVASASAASATPARRSAAAARASSAETKPERSPRPPERPRRERGPTPPSSSDEPPSDTGTLRLAFRSLRVARAFARAARSPGPLARVERRRAPFELERQAPLFRGGARANDRVPVALDFVRAVALALRLRVRARRLRARRPRRLLRAPPRVALERQLARDARRPPVRVCEVARRPFEVRSKSRRLAPRLLERSPRLLDGGFGGFGASLRRARARLRVRRRVARVSKRRIKACLLPCGVALAALERLPERDVLRSQPPAFLLEVAQAPSRALRLLFRRRDASSRLRVAARETLEVVAELRGDGALALERRARLLELRARRAGQGALATLAVGRVGGPRERREAIGEARAECGGGDVRRVRTAGWRRRASRPRGRRRERARVPGVGGEGPRPSSGGVESSGRRYREPVGVARGGGIVGKESGRRGRRRGERRGGGGREAGGGVAASSRAPPAARSARAKASASGSPRVAGRARAFAEGSSDEGSDGERAPRASASKSSAPTTNRARAPLSSSVPAAARRSPPPSRSAAMSSSMISLARVVANASVAGDPASWWYSASFATAPSMLARTRSAKSFARARYAVDGVPSVLGGIARRRSEPVGEGSSEGSIAPPPGAAQADPSRRRARVDARREIRAKTSPNASAGLARGGRDGRRIENSHGAQARTPSAAAFFPNQKIRSLKFSRNQKSAD